jgi:hypothetical protein
MFSIPSITQSSINQLIQTYANNSSYYYIKKLYNLWYITSTINDNIIQCRTYFQYTNYQNTFSAYWCGYFNYNTFNF